ncbi:Uncharacterized mitochondrial protein AtMg00300, partial [Striga hermonthica]
SISRLDVLGFSFKFGHGCFSLFDKHDSVIGSGIFMDGLYKLKLDVDFSASLMCVHQNIGIKHGVANENSAFLWHKRLGHVSKERMQRLVKDEILSDLDFTDFGLCVDCIKGKQTKHNKKEAKRSSKLLEIIHTDIWERYKGTAGKVGNFVKAVMRKSKTKATGCPFMIKVKLDATSQKFCISVPLDDEKGTHNHAFAVNPEGQRQMRGLSDPSREIVRDMSSAQATPAVILAAIQEKHPVDNATIRQVYNHKAKLWKENLEGRDVAGQLLHMATVSNYIGYTDVDPNTQALTHVFMSHPQAASLFWTYYWYVDIDSTYKTN